jgi:hypothetical protein
MLVTDKIQKRTDVLKLFFDGIYLAYGIKNPDEPMDPLQDTAISNVRFNTSEMQRDAKATSESRNLPRNQPVASRQAQAGGGDWQYAGDVNLLNTVISLSNMFGGVEKLTFPATMKLFEASGNDANMLRFLVNEDLYISQRLAAMHEANYKRFENMDDEEDNDAEYLDMVENVIWVWRNGFFVRKSDNVRIADVMKEKAFCDFAGLVGAEDPECKSFIIDCILQDNSAGLDKCMKTIKENHNWFKAMRSDVDKAHPSVVKVFLERFGFEPGQVWSEKYQQNIVRMETVSSWKKRIVKMDTAPKNRLKELNSNEDILRLFGYFVDFVNQNVGILNRHLGAENTMVVDDSQSTWAMKNNLTRHVFAQGGPVSIATPLLGSIVGTMSRNGTGFMSGSPIATMSTTRPLFGGERHLMSGGGNPYNNLPNLVTHDLQASVNNNSNILGSKLISDLIHQNIEQLKAKQYSLKPETARKIQRQIADYKKNESMLLQTARYLEEFNRLRGIFSFNSGSPRPLSIADLAKTTSRFNKLNKNVGSSENTLLKIAQQLERLLTRVLK